MAYNACVFLFCVRKDALNSFLAFVIDVLVFRCVPDILCLLNIIGPDMPRYGFTQSFEWVHNSRVGQFLQVCELLLYSR